MVQGVGQSRVRGATRAGIIAAAQWTGVEVGVLLLGGILVLRLSIPFVSGTAYIIERSASIVALLLLGLLFRRKAIRERLSRQALGYGEFRQPVVIAGVAAGILLFLGVAGVTGVFDGLLFPWSAARVADQQRALSEGGILAAALLLSGNGVLGPIVEEYAWRGYIQHALTQGLGLRSGVAVTAALFAAKHVVADFAVIRLTTLLVISLALGLVRVRWSTTVATIVHIILNFAATSLAIADAFLGDASEL